MLSTLRGNPTARMERSRSPRRASVGAQRGPYILSAKAAAAPEEKAARKAKVEEVCDLALKAAGAERDMVNYLVVASDDHPIEECSMPSPSVTLEKQLGLKTTTKQWTLADMGQTAIPKSLATGADAIRGQPDALLLLVCYDDVKRQVLAVVMSSKPKQNCPNVVVDFSFPFTFSSQPGEIDQHTRSFVSKHNLERFLSSMENSNQGPVAVAIGINKLLQPRGTDTYVMGSLLEPEVRRERAQGTDGRAVAPTVEQIFTIQFTGLKRIVAPQTPLVAPSMNNAAVFLLAVAAIDDTPFRWRQQELMAAFFENVTILPELRSKAEKLFNNMCIDFRHVMTENGGETENGEFRPRDERMNMLLQQTSQDYMALLEKVGRRIIEKYLHQVAEKALKRWGGDRKKITHVVYASDTHFLQNKPSMSAKLSVRLGLNPEAQHITLSDMGCCGGYQALTLCEHIARTCPGSRILVVMSEAAGAQHVARQEVPDQNDLLQFALFADGWAAAVVGSGELATHEKKGNLLEFSLARTYVIPFSDDMITHKYLARCVYSVISEKLPEQIAKNVPAFVGELMGEAGMDSRSRNIAWLVHPGGPKIVREIEAIYGLEPAQIGHSWETLRKYGNMAGVTNLAVLDEFLSGDHVSGFEYALGLSFGPGICMQAIWFRIRRGDSLSTSTVCDSI